MRKNLGFKAPRGQSSEDVKTVKTIKESTSNSGFKNQVEAIINLEGAALNQKHYVVANYGPLDSKLLGEIADIKEKNEGYSFTIVSPWAIDGTGVDAISNEGIELKELPAAVEEPEEKPKPEKKEKKAAKGGKKGKGKKAKGGD